jgi:uncharacterized protein (TIGR02099 family)
MTLLRQLLRILLQLAAGFVIVLALLVGVLRLVLPEAATLTDEIKTAVNDATGFIIDFRFISAGVSHHGPELRFLDVTLSWSDGEQIIAADKLVVSASVGAALFEKKFLPSRVLVEGSAVDVEITAAGELNLQGRSWRELLPPEQENSQAVIPDMQLQFADLGFEFTDRRRNVPVVAGFVSSFDADLEDKLIELSADIFPGEELGSQLAVEAEIPLRLLLADEDVAVDRTWSLTAELDDFRLAAWLALLDAPALPVLSSEGSIEIILDFKGLQAQDTQVYVDLQNIQLAQPDAAPVLFDWIEGALHWRLASGGWLTGSTGLRLSRNNQVWPESNYSIRFVTGSEPGTERYIVAANFLRLDDVMPIVRSIIPQQLTNAGVTGEPRGDLTSLSGEILLRDKKPEDFSIETGFASLGYVDLSNGLELSGYSGELEAGSDGGDLNLRTREARFGVDSLFRGALDITSLQGVAVWRRAAEGYRLLANDIELETPHGSATASMEILTDAKFSTPVVDINVTASMDDVTNVPFYLPKILSPDVLDWVDNGLIAGRVPEARLELNGPIKEFPFLQDQGEFQVRINVVDGVLDYAPDWPMLTDISGEIVFANESLYSRKNILTIAGMQLRQAEIRIDDLNQGVLTASNIDVVSIPDVLTFLQNSPVRDALGPVLDDVQAEGMADTSLSLVLPIKDMDAWQLEGEFLTNDATFGLAGIEPQFTEFSASGAISNTKISITDGTASLLGETVNITVRPATAAETDFSHRADISGNIPVRPLWEAFDLPDEQFYEGITSFTARALFPVVEQESDVAVEPFRLLVESELGGAISLLPYPLSKLAEQTELLLAEWRFPDAGIIDFTGSLERGLNWVMRLEEGADGYEIERALVTPNAPSLKLPDEPGIRVAGYIDLLVFDDWVEAFESDEEEMSDWEQMFSSIDIQVGEFYGADFRIVDVDILAKPLATAWDVTVAGPWAEGQLTVPFDLTGPQSMTMDMQRLLLIEPQETPVGEDPVDPRELPTLKGRVKEFALGEQRFGDLKVELTRTEFGLRTEKLHTESDSFTIEASADWEVIDSAQRTRLHAELTSTDMLQTLKDLDYDPYMTAKKGKVIADLLWEGSPSMAMVYESTGTVSMDVRNGVLYEVDPGGARLLGLLSVAAIPRRLSLDFSEMTEDGLPFDSLSGTFRIDFGNAFTCDLGLEGDIADMGIVGRTGMLAEDYDQIAAVRPHVSNLAPVAGAFLAGPAVGVATLLITQIFKKPLSGIGGTYYTITGSWDDPKIEPANQTNLDLTAFSECEQELPEMSPEGIQALQDFLKERQPEKVVLPEGMFPADSKQGPQRDEE